MTEDDVSLSPTSQRAAAQETGSPTRPTSAKLPELTEGGEDEAAEEQEDDDDQEAKASLWTRIKNYLLLAWAVIAGLLDYLIGVLEDLSHEYREISRELDKQKEAEKQKLLDERAQLAVTDGTQSTDGAETDGAAAKDGEKLDPSAVHLVLDIKSPATPEK